MLAFFAARATPGVEVVDGDCYRRSISWNGCPGYFEVSLDEALNAFAVRVEITDSCSLYAIIERIRNMFDLNADWSAIAEGLGSDCELRRRIRAHPGIRVPGCWSGFELTVRAILGQQISVAGATTLAGRISHSFGQPFSGPAGLTRMFPTASILSEADLTNVGLTKNRAQTICALARAVRDGRICFEKVHDSNALLAQLVSIPGIGDWTAQYVAMRALGEPDAFPSGDLGLLRALGLTSSRELEERAIAWRPWRAYASMYLWSTAESFRNPKNSTASSGFRRLRSETFSSEKRSHRPAVRRAG
jgi:AraC family transcriptional regulator of adaptative response / DNA-3-methyladenine glycosylase II